MNCCRKLRTFATQMTFPAKRLFEEGHGMKWIIQEKELTL